MKNKISILRKALRIKLSKVFAISLALTLIAPSMLSVFKVSAIENANQYAAVRMRGATDVADMGSTYIFRYDGGTVSINGAVEPTTEAINWNYGDHTGDMLVFYTKSTALEFVTTPEQGYVAEARIDGQLTNLTTDGTYNKNDLVIGGEDFEIEFSFFSQGDGPAPAAPGNTTATFDYTFSGSIGLDWYVNGRMIDVGSQEFEEVGNTHHTTFEDTYDSDPADATVTFTFETLFIDIVDNLVINGTSYNSSLPRTAEELANHYGAQHLAFDVVVPVADTYTIVSHTHEADGDEMFMGNFLWDNDTSKLDELSEDDERRDDIIGHGTLEFVKATYNGVTYDSVEGLNAAGGVFSFDNNDEPGDTVGSMTLPTGTMLTVRLTPEAGYQLVSFGINGGEFEPQENIGEYTFEILGGNGHIAANFAPVDDAVAANSDAIESGSIVLGTGETSITSGTARLDVDDMELDGEDIEGFETAADGYDIKSYLDISLYNTIYKGSETDSWDTEITELDHEATITLKLEEGIDGNEVIIIHQKHDGTYEVIPTTYDPVARTITFKTSSFSNYAIATRSTAEVASPDTGFMTKENGSAKLAISGLLFAIIATLVAIKSSKVSNKEESDR